jgi:hypothetical protein
MIVTIWKKSASISCYTVTNDAFRRIVNALVAAETMTGANGFTAHELPHDRLQAVLKKYGRLREPVDLR